MINSEEGVACTGNIVIDSIINFKLQEATRQEIAVTTNFNIPKKMKIASFDITVILGNLLDNALNAVTKLANNRYIDIEMEYKQGRFILNIENSFNGVIIKKDGAMISSHCDKENHGLGLESVKTVVEKYNGTMEFKYDENKFSTMLFMDIE
ncbi:MAG TPA: sensor histidine kinase [Epulopiscium sp.]|nr:sensor histidine kinase [Candidatus Epulonipiscium sp.]